MSNQNSRRRDRSRSPYQRNQRPAREHSDSESRVHRYKPREGSGEVSQGKQDDHTLNRRHKDNLPTDRTRFPHRGERNRRERDAEHRRGRGRQRGETEDGESSQVQQTSEQGEDLNESNQPLDGPNYKLSGKLTEYTNTYKGVVIKYNEPSEARKPKTRWRLYPFKGEETLSVMYVHRQSAYLMGRQRHIVDIATDHPSCSKQHAVLQYRLVDYKRADGTPGRKVKPYIIDLESANGTYLNNQRIDARRFYELKEKDVLKFGFSTREYVILTEKSQESDDDSEPNVEETNVEETNVEETAS